MKVDSTKEVLKIRRWVLAAASERYTAARAGMTGKRKPVHATPRSNESWLHGTIKAYILTPERSCHPV